jgi:phosphohistidine phosphatase
MKTFYFIRHAKSSWKDAVLEDAKRPLNKRGKTDAPFMAKRLKHFGVTPDLILSSPALRAQKTAEIIAKTLKIETITYEPRLYESSVETYIEVLQSLDASYNDIMIIAHNPEITLACEYFADAILGNIPTCGIVGMQYTPETFDEVGEGCATLLFFDYPKKHR